MSAKRKDPSATKVDAENHENHVPAPNLASASVKRRFVPPKMACSAGQTAQRPLASKARNVQPVRAAPSAPKPAAAAGSSATPDGPAQYFSILYTKKSNKVKVHGRPASVFCVNCVAAAAPCMTLEVTLLTMASRRCNAETTKQDIRRR